MSKSEAGGEEPNVAASPSKTFISFLYLPIQRILAYYSLLKVLTVFLLSVWD